MRGAKGRFQAQEAGRLAHPSLAAQRLTATSAPAHDFDLRLVLEPVHQGGPIGRPCQRPIAQQIGLKSRIPPTPRLSTWKTIPPGATRADLGTVEVYHHALFPSISEPVPLTPLPPSRVFCKDAMLLLRHKRGASACGQGRHRTKAWGSAFDAARQRRCVSNRAGMRLGPRSKKIWLGRFGRSGHHEDDGAKNCDQTLRYLWTDAPLAFVWPPRTQHDLDLHRLWHIV